MAALKWIVVALCGASALGLAGVGVKNSHELLSHESVASMGAKVTLRPLPPPVGAASAVPTAKTPAPVAAPAVPAPAVPSAPTEAPDAGAPAPSPPAAAPPAAKDAGAAPPPAPPPAPPVAAAKPPAPAPPPAAAPAPAPAPAGEGVLNLKANATADVFVDSKRVGSSPVTGLKIKTGPHKVRFDCYDDAGNTVAGAVQNVTVTADEPAEVNFTCPAAE